MKEMGKAVLKSLPASIQIEHDGGDPLFPMIEHEIRFNGVGELSHETFLLMIENPSFEFCKTARKPYDLPVCCMLILASLFADSGEISSDGIGESYCDQEWRDAWKHLSEVVEFITVDPEHTLKLFPSYALAMTR